MPVNRRKVKQGLWISLALLVAGFAALNLLAYRHAYRMMHYASSGFRTRQVESLSGWGKLRVLLCGVNIPRPHGSRTPSSVGLPFREAMIEVPGGVRLGGWFCPRHDARTVAVLFHGYASEKSSLLAEARQFYELGCAVLLVDFRGSGQSSESYTTLGYEEAEDVAAAVAYARAQCPGARVALFGQSMGAAAVLRAVNRRGVQPDAIVIEAVFDTLLDTVRHRFELLHVPAFPAAQLLVFWGGWQMGFDGFAHNPADDAAGVRCPALVMHGRGDRRARLPDAQRVHARLAGAKTFVTFDDAGHEPYVKRHRDEWRAAVQKLLLDSDREDRK
jgi:pimeloyl-ACP methyl ester carboxylesterase